MKLHNLLKDNFFKLILIFLFINPFLDILTGISLNYFNHYLTWGLVGKSIFLIIVVYYILFINKNNFSSHSKIFIVCVFFYVVIFLLTNYFFEGLTDILGEIKYLIRILYFPIVLLGIFNFSYNSEINIKMKYLKVILSIYVFTILITSTSGFLSYNDSKIGSVGIFNSANEIGAIISLLIPFVIYDVFYANTKKKFVINVLICLNTFLVALIMGTKVPLFAFAFSFVSIFIHYFVRLIKNKSYKKSVILFSGFLILIIMCAILIPKTPFYKNIMIHTKFLKINSVTEIFTDYKNIDRFIFSDRLTFASDTVGVYKNASIGYKILGIGYYDKNLEYKLIEIDYLDIIFRYGIIGLILVYTPYIYILFRKNGRKHSLEKYFPYYISILLTFMLGIFSGHVFTAPAVSLLVAIIVSILKTKGERTNKR